jgi:hypothetical protein
MFVAQWIRQLFTAQAVAPPTTSAFESMSDAHARTLLRANGRHMRSGTNSTQFNYLTGPDPVLSAYGRQVDSCTGPEARALLAALFAAHRGEPLDEWRRRLVG